MIINYLFIKSTPYLFSEVAVFHTNLKEMSFSFVYYMCMSFWVAHAPFDFTNVVVQLLCYLVGGST